jgi:hypothetical protein
MIKLGYRWAVLAAQLVEALQAEGRNELARQVGELEVHELCGCGDSFCQSFYTAPRPEGAYGPGHRCLPLDAPWSGMLVLDLVAGQIVYVEVLDRSAPLGLELGQDHGA